MSVNCAIFSSKQAAFERPESPLPSPENRQSADRDSAERQQAGCRMEKAAAPASGQASKKRVSYHNETRTGNIRKTLGNAIRISDPKELTDCLNP